MSAQITNPVEIAWPPNGSIWRHYKGARYRVVGQVWLEATAEPAVAYRSADNELERIWVRSLADWHAAVQQGARFERIEE